MKKLLILSGKGGTGKTTLTSSFIELSKAKAFADCDVEAPNLHLLNNTGLKETKPYHGMKKAKIDTEKCIGCGLCRDHCRFFAIEYTDKYLVNHFACEGCSVCELVCPENAIEMIKYKDGEMTLFRGLSTFSTAELNMGSGNSGKLVTAVKKQLFESIDNEELVIIDGSPGIGCPVIASISGVDMVLIVSEPSISGISDMDRIIKTAKIFGVKIAVCVNKFDVNIDLTSKIRNYCYDLDLDFVGEVPYDKRVTDLTNNQELVINYDFEVSKAIKNVYLNTISILNL